jgi:hypothetical protein
MNDKLILTSGINIIVYLIISTLIYFAIRIINIFVINLYLRIFIYFILLISNYFSAFHLINRCYFFENSLRIKYYCRFINRVQIFRYKDILNFKYVSTVSKNDLPTIFFNLKNKRYSFPLCSYRKRKVLFTFLRQKEIEIEIDSIFKKDYSI